MCFAYGICFCVTDRGALPCKYDRAGVVCTTPSYSITLRHFANLYSLSFCIKLHILMFRCISWHRFAPRCTVLNTFTMLLVARHYLVWCNRKEPSIAGNCRLLCIAYVLHCAVKWFVLHYSVHGVWCNRMHCPVQGRGSCCQLRPTTSSVFRLQPTRRMVMMANFKFKPISPIYLSHCIESVHSKHSVNIYALFSGFSTQPTTFLFSA